MKKNKVLIIRFSSFGDILQGSTIPRIFKLNNPDVEVHWLTREDFVDLVKLNADVDEVIGFDRKGSLFDLVGLSWRLRQEGYDYVYDVHNNLRSNVIGLIFRFFNFRQYLFLKRSKNRFKRFFLFSFRINLFPKPFKGRKSFEEPLKKWGLKFKENESVAHFNFDRRIVAKVESTIAPFKNKTWVTLVPSAAWAMKRWPIENWKEILKNSSKDYFFVFLGGPEDKFIEEIVKEYPDSTLNLAGKLSLVESSYLVSVSNWIIANDTGLLHVADLFGIHGLSLQGPTAFGFTTHPNLITMEVDLSCRPCTKDGRGKCINTIYQKCMVDITPSSVLEKTQIYFNK